jgi:mycobactin lysine-N-oxygenase
VLRGRLGKDKVPQLIVVERDKVGSAWDGDGNYSNGFVTLCTPGEKDVGFPYDEVWTDEGTPVSISSELFARFSFSAYQIATGRFADWVDRGRDHPSHSRFADYLEWVFDEADEGVVYAEVTKVRHAGGKWRVDYKLDGEDKYFTADGVVLTGNGEPRPIEIDVSVPAERVLTAESFWAKRHDLVKPGPHVEVAVAGDGGAAGTIVAWLAQRFAETQSQVLSISPMGTLFPRGDGHAERRWFTDPADWSTLTLAHRRKLIERTEAGVISMRNKCVIDASTRISYHIGHLSSVQFDADGKLQLKTKYDKAPGAPVAADYLVNAVGFDSWTRLALVEHPAAQGLARLVPPVTEESLKASREVAETKVEADLSMPRSLGFPAGLHVPALAAVPHGPGIGNLGCLGLMARKILQGYE